MCCLLNALNRSDKEPTANALVSGQATYFSISALATANASNARDCKQVEPSTGSARGGSGIPYTCF